MCIDGDSLVNNYRFEEWKSDEIGERCRTRIIRWRANTSVAFVWQIALWSGLILAPRVEIK